MLVLLTQILRTLKTKPKTSVMLYSLAEDHRFAVLQYIAEMWCSFDIWPFSFSKVVNNASFIIGAHENVLL